MVGGVYAVPVSGMELVFETPGMVTVQTTHLRSCRYGIKGHRYDAAIISRHRIRTCGLLSVNGPSMERV